MPPLQESPVPDNDRIEERHELINGDRWRPASRVRDECGAVLIMVALSSVALLGFLGLALDVGYMYHHRRVMQSAADAGAIAGGAR